MRPCLIIWLFAFVLGAFSALVPAGAQHVDVLVQRQGNKLYTGVADFDDFEWSMGTRVFARDFDSDFLIDTPGYNALAGTSSAMPAGFSALPGLSPLSWDFLPMRIGTAVSNLMYWDGLDTNADGVDLDDVDFTPARGHILSLQGLTGTAAADATNQLIQGFSVGNTGSNGSIHVHRNYQLVDENAEPGVFLADGIYLVAMQLRITGLEHSDPFYLVFGTPGSTFAARSAAVDWVTERVDTLTALGLPGDYNDDGVVDAADYTVWRNSLGMSIALPNEDASPNVVDAEDYAVWKQNYGQSNTGAAGGAGGLAGAAVPEPGTLVLALSTACGLALNRKRRASLIPPPAHRAPGSIPPPR